MRILLNAATAVVGGGAQVAASFIANTHRDPRGHSFSYAASPLVAEQVRALLGDASPERLVVTPSPAKLIRGRQSRRAIQALADDFRPDLVYSITSPSYVDFGALPEVARFTDGWLTHPNRLAFSRLSLRSALDLRLRERYKAWALRRVKLFHTQSQVAADGLRGRLSLKEDQVEVIPNCANQIFHASEEAGYGRGKGGDEIVLVLGNPYPHKNFDLVPDVACALKQQNERARFQMTLPAGHPMTHRILTRAQKLGVADRIQNLGRIDLRQCREAYLGCSLVFLPTLLETFSATYLEAMAVGRPVVTTDLDFARDQCGDAAEFFEPLDAGAAADAIQRVLSDQQRYMELVENGRKNLARFPSPDEKYEMQLAWLEHACRECCL